MKEQGRLKNSLNKFKKPLIITALAVLAISYYIYLSNKDVNNDDKMTSNSEASELISRDMEKNYPATPRAVLSYFIDIQKVWYKEDISEDELNGLVQHTRALYDDELLAANEYETYIASLKAEIDTYKENERYISEYIIEDGYNIRYKSFNGRTYAFVNVKYYIREDENLRTVYEEYTLRKDADSRWKILFWKLTDGTAMEEQ